MPDSNTYDHHAVNTRYGRTPETDEHALNYLKMLKIVMSMDGELSDVAAFESFLHGLGIADEFTKQVDAFSANGVAVKDVVPDMRHDGQLARLLVRDAVALMSQDGVYRVIERATVAKLACELGVGMGTVASIETLVELERSAARLHQALFHAE